MILVEKKFQVIIFFFFCIHSDILNKKIIDDEGFDYDEYRDLPLEDDVTSSDNMHEDLVVENNTWMDEVFAMLNDTEDPEDKFVINKGTLHNLFLSIFF